MKPLLSVLFLVGRIFSPPYSLVMLLRSFLYRNNIFLKSQQLQRPVISVGNLTLGGTGKTPMVRYVARLLLDRGVRPAIVSRGYGGKAGGKVNIVADGGKILLAPEMAGDEPFMLAEALPGVPVLTGSERARVARQAIDVFGVHIIVMDDGFQHLAVRRDLDLVLFSAGTLLGNGQVFPGGELREPLSALGRAHAFVVTGVDRSNRSGVDNFQRWLQGKFPQTPVFLGEYLPAGIWHSGQGQVCTLAEARNMQLFAFAGIANPDSFRQTLRQEEFSLTGFKEYRDHHGYTAQDVADLVAAARASGAQALIATEKDFVKLRPYFGEFPILALTIELRMDLNFDRFMAEQLSGFSL
ncbi:tetraacyldisaccharide 4'-kinase [Thiovibrio frasassiensis]|jgi:tetraacyldisaccharide 4'-kinase|uniref:Tetraacyldisaccharide 4'-kinase n=1 Tax=Thiovibrio frasassiensis TaxID=2984131 RepID=A0A9X4MHM1_9BACT|nr:tetraacyldisaccharide 4'-kinase [Thiovibrio frasassiensis]MDG4476501.1 tetraacyldisaccharide 4'-kinase [Thiovibrio frasassiensis]